MAIPPESELRELYFDKCLTTREVGARFGVSHMSVRRWFLRYDIEPRPGGRGLANRGGHRPSDDVLLDMIHVQHLPFDQIGKRFGVSSVSALKWAREAGIRIPTPWETMYKGNAPKMPPADEVRRRYEVDGWSHLAIADAFGVTESQIRRFCHANGIRPRSNGFKNGRRFECADGHVVKSLYEQRVCNWLADNEIEHIYEPILPFGKRALADFYANGWYIEIWGVAGNAAYTRQRDRKRALYKTHELPLLEISDQAFRARLHDWWIRTLTKSLTAPPHPAFVAQNLLLPSLLPD